MDDPIDAAIHRGHENLVEPAAKAVLRDRGITVPRGTVVSDPEEAVANAEKFGFPVVLKIVSPDVPHKTEWGGGRGVTLGVESADDVRSRALEILRLADREGIEASILVEESIDVHLGTEMIVGGLRDPSFGPVVMVGMGGIFTEIFEDTAHRLAPIDPAEARRMIESLRSERILRGYRGRTRADIEAFAQLVVEIGALLDSERRIGEIDLNPVLVTESETVVLDALIGVQPQ